MWLLLFVFEGVATLLPHPPPLSFSPSPASNPPGDPCPQVAVRLGLAEPVAVPGRGHVRHEAADAADAGVAPADVLHVQDEAA